MNLKELYQELILEHGKNPRNLGKTDNFNKDAKGNNPLCGDNVHVYLKLNGHTLAEEMSFAGSGGDVGNIGVYYGGGFPPGPIAANAA